MQAAEKLESLAGAGGEEMTAAVAELEIALSELENALRDYQW